MLGGAVDCMVTWRLHAVPGGRMHACRLNAVLASCRLHAVLATVCGPGSCMLGLPTACLPGGRMLCYWLCDGRGRGACCAC